MRKDKKIPLKRKRRLMTIHNHPREEGEGRRPSSRTVAVFRKRFFQRKKRGNHGEKKGIAAVF